MKRNLTKPQLNSNIVLSWFNLNMVNEVCIPYFPSMRIIKMHIHSIKLGLTKIDVEMFLLDNKMMF